MATTTTAARQDPGSFWVDCANVAKGTCAGKKAGGSGLAQGHLSPKGKPILCRRCQAKLKVRGSYLEQPTATEKRQYIRGRGKANGRKRVTARQTAKLAARKGSKATVTGKSKRPKAKTV